jgi:hypothetical protein
MTKQELIKRARHHFNNEKTKMVFVTEDGHCFHAHSKNHALNHIKGTDLELFEINRADISGKTVKESAQVKEDVKDEAPQVEASSFIESNDEPRPKTKNNKGKA